MQIVDLDPADAVAMDQAAGLLVEGFKEHWPHAWPDMDAARREAREALQPDRINRVAVEEDGAVVGWAGAISGYGGRAWELHPLVVRPDRQGRGIGRALVADLETRVRERGGLTIYLGTDDEDGLTTLANTDLYPDVVRHLAEIRNLARHPYTFYQKQGYAIVGVIPDANGWGKPDILMAKRVGGA
jgi:aminoglycoside 6'-N-acetyltransferase I